MTDEELRDALWAALDDKRAGMLVVAGSGHHPQPMTHYPDRDGDCLWFITSAQTDLFGAIDAKANGQFTVVSEDGSTWAALDGPIAVSEDTGKLDDLWSPFAAAWFEGGRDDPNVRLLKLTLKRASVWASTDSMFVFGYEMTKANLKDGAVPDIGSHGVIAFG